MARLFGMIAQRPVDLTISLPDRYRAQALTHGWGLGWYEGKKPILKKQQRSSLAHDENEGVNTSLQSTIAIMHMRQANSGSVSEQNIHPFTYKNFMFAHTGSINKDQLLPKLTKPYNESFQSEPIDSEVLFRYLIQHIDQMGPQEGIKIVLSEIQTIIGATFLLSDGESLFCYRKSQPLYWLSWKVGSAFTALAKTTGIGMASNALAQTRGIILSSEKMTDGNWMVVDDDELLTISNTLNYVTIKIH